MTWVKYVLVSIFISAMLTTNAHAHIILGVNRVIYKSTQREISIPVRNSDVKRAYLVQSWVENEVEKKNERMPFIITPPLFRLAPDQENILRLVFTGAELPNDKETLFWLNVKGIPSTIKSDSNTLLLSINNRIKLFYRPVGLTGNMADAYKSLSFSRQGNTLVIKNPSPYYISFNEISVGGKKINIPGMVSPKSELTHKLERGMEGDIFWSAINDFGAVSDLFLAAL
ncbi:fimbrial biogenesis chaperone [Aeromonas salmonicida]